MPLFKRNAFPDPYTSSWNGSNKVPTKNDIWDALLHRAHMLKAFQALGSSYLAVTLSPLGAPGLIANATSRALNDGEFVIHPIYIDQDITITGVKWWQVTQGVYTADNNNRIGLYSYSGGTLTLVASCADDGTLWKGASNSFQTKAFSASYAASAGLYFIGMLYNSSAQTTQPTIGVYTASAYSGSASTHDFTNSAKFAGTLAGQTNLPSPQLMSGMTASTGSGAFFALY